MPVAAYPTGTDRCNTLISAPSKLVYRFSLVMASVGGYFARRESIFSSCAFCAQVSQLAYPSPSRTPLTIG
jgi:hypothetical protein